MKPTLLLLFSLLLLSCNNQAQQQKEDKKPPNQPLSQQSPEDIIEEHLENGAWKHALYSKEWQAEIDKGLAKDSTIAYLWQQKAMPLFKQGKYQLGMAYIDKAVMYDAGYQDYRAFIKCIFAKTYPEAIADFEDCIAKNGNAYVMDHSYNFYIAISKLQLNKFIEAETILKKEIDLAVENDELLHHVDLFYYGISKYEQQQYQKAIAIFDRALKRYPQFPDVQYYKAICLGKLGRKEEAQKLAAEAQANAKKGYSMNEDNAIYERYPYQVRWRFHSE